MFLILILAGNASAEATDYATGDTLVYTVMISDSDNSFDQNMEDTVEHHMDRVENYYEDRAPSEANLDMEMEYQKISISYSGNYRDSYDYVEKSLNQLGYEGDRREATRELVESKESEGYDNVALLTVAPSSGRSFMLPTGNTEFTTVYYYKWDNAFAELINLDDTPSVVYAHELGHIFGAEDEYYEEGNTGYGEISNNPSGSLQRLYPSFNYENGPSVEESMMASYGTWDSLGWFDIGTPMSSWAKGMIGWRDFDLDGTLDPNEENILVKFPNDRKPILNAGIDTGTQIRYTEFDEVTAESRYDDASLVEEFGFNLKSPNSRTVDSSRINATNNVIQSSELEANVPDAEKPGNWTVNFLYGSNKAAWYDIEVIAPLVQLSADTVDLGRVNVDDEETGSITISNQGKMQLTATNTDITTEEQVTEQLNSFNVNSLSSGTQQFTITPSDTGSINGEISFSTNDPRNEEISVPLSGFAYAVRYLDASSPNSAKVDEQVGITVEFEETSKTPSEYSLEIKRNGQPVTNADYISTEDEFGETTLEFGKYGDYNVTVDKSDSREYEYRSDWTTFNIERLVKNLQLNMEVSQTQVDPGDEVQVTAKADGQRIESELLVDGESYGQGETFNVKLDEPGTHDLKLTKADLKTDREVRKYEPVEETVEVSERSLFGKITNFFSNLF